MSDTVIRVENLGKKYIIGHQQQERYTALRDVITNKVKSIGSLIIPKAKNENPAFEEFWALKDVSFDIKQGDRVGIIGRNGAGKSTLLKILSRITEPTIGSIKIKGRVASLLEVGTGFHPELTGRENIFLNGAILGMGKEEIKRKFDEIVAFAEVEKFLDTPVKRYSSGMYVRLAFAVAAHLDPEILIIDEVLAVGDAAFQEKCLGKLEETSNNQRKTIILVSHNVQSISRLCNSCLWLNSGKVQDFGYAQKVINNYYSNKKRCISTWVPNENELLDTSFVYKQISIIAPEGSTSDAIPASKSFTIEFIYQIKTPHIKGRIALQIRRTDGIVSLSSANTDKESFIEKEWMKGDFVEKCVIPDNLLAPSGYYLTVSQPTADGHNHIYENICFFCIDPSDSLVSRDGRQGIIAPILDWQVIYSS